MSRLRSTPGNRIEFALAGFGFFALALSVQAFARPGKDVEKPELPCAIVQSYSGDAQILDSSRTVSRDALPHAPVSCGGWVSVQHGWVILKNQRGDRIHLGARSFARFQEGAGDQGALVLYRGQVYAHAVGKGELRILTPNARARVSQASVITLFDPVEENTQLIAVDGNSVLENRFQGGKRTGTNVKSGFVSSLNFKRLRVLPAVPRITESSSLKDRLTALHVPLRERERALEIARNRKREYFATLAKAKVKAKARRKSKARAPGRSLASTGSFKKRHAIHRPFHGSATAMNQTQDLLLRETLGGNREGLKLLKHPARRRKPRLEDTQTEASEARFLRKQQKAEWAEKQRLIEELTKIHAE